jgi:alkylation response protein AidB-like acyl-CoA dehydrogenase
MNGTQLNMRTKSLLSSMGIAIQATRFARVCYEEALKYAHKRKTFGKRLVDHPVIRNKLAHMARQIEAT